MQDNIKICNLLLYWTRNAILILSIIVVFISLIVYQKNSVPHMLLLERHELFVVKNQQIFVDMIRDKRLIATLVATQASIGFPSFLLATSSKLKSSLAFVDPISTLDLWKIAFEQICQLLMPLGLALVWIVFIIFDAKLDKDLLSQYNTNFTDCSEVWCRLLVYVAENLIYFIIIICMIEVLTMCTVTFKVFRYLRTSRRIHQTI